MDTVGGEKQVVDMNSLSLGSLLVAIAAVTKSRPPHPHPPKKLHTIISKLPVSKQPVVLFLFANELHD